MSAIFTRLVKESRRKKHIVCRCGKTYRFSFFLLFSPFLSTIFPLSSYIVIVNRKWNINTPRAKQNIRRWSLNHFTRNGKAVKKPFYNFMPTRLHKSKLIMSVVSDDTHSQVLKVDLTLNSFTTWSLFLAVSQDGSLLNESDQIEQITNEIEQYDHLMETTYKSEQLRIDTIKSMPQSLAAKRLIRARLLRSINRRSHLSSTNSSAFKNCKFFPVIFIKKVRRWYRQTFKYCDFWYSSMKDIEGRFGSKLAVYFKILRYLVMLNLFVTVFTFR